MGMGRNGKGNNRASGGNGRCGGKGAAQVGVGGTTSAQQGGLSSLGPVGPGEHLDFTLERWGPR